MTDSAAASLLPFVLLGVSALLPVAAVSILLLAGRLDLRRSVLVHVPAAEAWETIRHFPGLHERHGKARGLVAIEQWTVRRGDGESPGTVWRAHGRWGEAAYWADVEIVRADPGRELAITLIRDSLGTHHGLEGHLGSMTLEAIAPGTTKLTWRLRARLRGPRLRLARTLSAPRLRARLFDQGLRSIKVRIEQAAARAAGASGSAAPAGHGPRARPGTIETPLADGPIPPPPDRRPQDRL
ncbi:MAG: SRPBCC family protein [Acidobacteria bacterium]|nr:SRPBCC family protein [Acidobacteriota bacterium]